MIEFIVIILVLAFLVLEGFFSGSETAIISANRAKLRLARSNGDPRAKLALALLRKSEKLLATTLVGTNVSVVTGTTLATWLIARWVPPTWDKSLVATLAMTPIILIVAELLPKCIFRHRADSMTLHISRPLGLAQRILYPLIALASGITRSLLWFISRNHTSAGIDVSRAELQALAQIGEEQGLLVPQSRRMIQSVFDLNERPIDTVMVPFSRITAVPVNATVQQVEQLAAKTGFSHFPVYQGSTDNVVGIVNLTDIMYGPAGRQESIQTLFSREVTRIPRDKSVGTLLTEFRYSQIPLAIVVDSAGRAVGLLSPQDILEELVGTIRQERAIHSDRIA